jgi:hypothetical protein
MITSPVLYVEALPTPTPSYSANVNAVEAVASDRDHRSPAQPPKEDVVRVQFLIESMPVWGATVETASFDLPAQVVARIRDHALFAATNRARVPRVEVKLIEQDKMPVA